MYPEELVAIYLLRDDAVKTVNLPCENGNHRWERKSQRGRLPKNCPEHPDSGAEKPLQQPRSVPVRVAEGSHTGDPISSGEQTLTTEERIDRLILRMQSLENKERTVIER